MGLRRLRNSIRGRRTGASSASRATGKNNSALIFGVFAAAAQCRLSVFEAL
jgi:hypothetical protein